MQRDDAHQNFSKVARLVEEKGQAIILKNNKPEFVAMSFSALQDDSLESTVDVIDETLLKMAKQFADKYDKALLELAK